MSLDVTVLQVDLGVSLLLSEQHLNLAGSRPIRVILQVRVDLPGDDETLWRLERKYGPPVTLTAVGVALVPATTLPRLEHGFGEVGLADVVADPPRVEALGEQGERLIWRDGHGHRGPHRRDGRLAHDSSPGAFCSDCCAICLAAR